MKNIIRFGRLKLFLIILTMLVIWATVVDIQTGVRPFCDGLAMCDSSGKTLSLAETFKRQGLSFLIQIAVASFLTYLLTRKRKE